MLSPCPRLLRGQIRGPLSSRDHLRTWAGTACSVPAVDEESGESGEPGPFLGDWRVRGLIGAALVAGFLIGLVVFGEPWRLPPDWGDIPTWLLVAAAVVGGWAALDQLRILRGQIADEVDRNKKRDELLDKQIAEAERRARSDRRRLVEDVRVSFGGHTGYVLNDSWRPVNDVTCKVMSKVDRNALATAVACGEVEQVGPAWQYLPEVKEVSRLETLRPGSRAGFSFADLPGAPDEVAVAWFTDDDGTRWQLDEFQHLAESGDESVYLPLPMAQPLPQREPDAAAALEQLPEPGAAGGAADAGPQPPS
jgi:hypothetical protein